MSNYQKPRLATPNPLQPAQYNKEQVEARLGRKVSSNVVRNMDDVGGIDRQIEAEKQRAREQIGRIAGNATAKIARLEEQKANGAK